MEVYEMEPYVDNSYNEVRAEYIQMEKLLVVVIALRLICNYWSDIDCPSFIKYILTREQLILTLTGYSLRLLGFIIFIYDINIICKNKKEIVTFILVSTWIFVKPLYFFLRGIVLDDSDVITRGVIESAIYFLILFLYVIGCIDNFAADLCSCG